jgi:dTMP kinase
MADKSIQGGLLIVFEGIDGVGKTTQIELTRQALAEQGWAVEIRRNLGGTPIGEALREVIKSPLERPGLTNLYISAAIQEALIEAVQKDRAAGKLILMDRGPISLAAYAVYGDGLDPEYGWPYVERGMQLLKPELTIIYQADVDLALKQAGQKPIILKASRANTSNGWPPAMLRPPNATRTVS